MSHSAKRAISHSRWGNSPWTIDFHPSVHSLPTEVDFAVVGGGFSGLSAAAWLRRLEPEKSVALFESAEIGAGSSGHTGGMALAETAAGNLPGLGDVLAGFSSILKELDVHCDLTLPGVYEIGRSNALPHSPIAWSDSGDLRAVKEGAGGMINPGKMVSGLARAAEESGALIFEHTNIDAIEFTESVRLRFAGGEIRARKVLLATNAMSLELTGLAESAQPKFTLALATEPLDATQLEALGLESERPFYTVDFPYLWGRTMRSEGVIFGGGLVHCQDWRELNAIDASEGEALKLLDRLESRVHGLHPVLQNVQITHRWGGPILLANEWRPVFAQHPQSPNAVVLGAFSGHGVAQSVYLGRWAAEALCGKRSLPEWGSK